MVLLITGGAVSFHFKVHLVQPHWNSPKAKARGEAVLLSKNPCVIVKCIAVKLGHGWVGKVAQAGENEEMWSVLVPLDGSSVWGGKGSGCPVWAYDPMVMAVLRQGTTYIIVMLWVMWYFGHVIWRGSSYVWMIFPLTAVKHICGLNPVLNSTCTHIIVMVRY